LEEAGPSVQTTAVAAMSTATIDATSSAIMNRGPAFQEDAVNFISIISMSAIDQPLSTANPGFPNSERFKAEG
jgi:hypothetical protein